MKYISPMTYPCQKFSSNYIKPLNWVCRLQELQRIEEQDKWRYEETIRQIEGLEHSGFLKSKCSSQKKKKKSSGIKETKEA